jgi:hypothetical protein
VVNLVGPLKRAPRCYTHLLVAIDTFTKWIEAQTIETIGSEQAVEFFLNIIHRFGVPNSIIMDNVAKFIGKKFLKLCDDYHIRVDWAAVAHPRTNGQVERVNGMILQGFKPRIFNRLKKFAGRWVAELPAVLWSLRMTPSRVTGFTPFFMVYGSEAVLPTDLDYGALRVRAYNEQGAEASLEDVIYQLDKVCDITLLRSA